MDFWGGGGEGKEVIYSLLKVNVILNNALWIHFKISLNETIA